MIFCMLRMEFIKKEQLKTNPTFCTLCTFWASPKVPKVYKMYKMPQFVLIEIPEGTE